MADDFEPEIAADDPREWLTQMAARGMPGAREALAEADGEVQAGASSHDAHPPNPLL